ncbi:RNA-binding protein with serine-rich domain 1-like [Gigantopelta aegis]|uniref:RNA-binding protein with serine-rich domain 1-like n=1 Tax=Gigantopelta aegis TaxID=1735272 RepID=UPI001B889E61|nr:RNA-binding protein with serine-rich domain 1-like [Gigantopelta aegis]
MNTSSGSSSGSGSGSGSSDSSGSSGSGSGSSFGLSGSFGSSSSGSGSSSYGFCFLSPSLHHDRVGTHVVWKDFFEEEEDQEEEPSSLQPPGPVKPAQPAVADLSHQTEFLDSTPPMLDTAMCENPQPATPVPAPRAAPVQWSIIRTAPVEPPRIPIVAAATEKRKAKSH